MDYKLIFTIHPAVEGFLPINIACQVPEELSDLLRRTPVKGVSIRIEAGGGVLVDATPLLEFKP